MLILYLIAIMIVCVYVCVCKNMCVKLSVVAMASIGLNWIIWFYYRNNNDI